MQNKYKLKLNHCQGFSLLEMFLVVSVGAVLILSGIAAYSFVNDNQKTNASIQLMQQIVSGTRKLYVGQPSYGTTGTNITKRLRDSGVIPENLPINAANTAVTGAYGGIIVVARDTAFDISFQRIPSKNCVTMLGSTNNIRGVVGAWVGTTFVTDFAPTALATSCLNGPHTIRWRFE